jgi:1,4-dihydroxy-2-naphthoate octaprenyltransferase
MSAARPASAHGGYVGWPLRYHRACLVHNRAVGWLYILGLVGRAITAVVR